MNASESLQHLPREFAQACDALRAATLRSEITITEIPPPARLAPYSVAMSAEVVAPNDFAAASGEDIDELATGRLVVLYDPSAPPEWGGKFRVVSYVRAELEHELGQDGLIGSVAWSWLQEALAAHGALYRAEGGTVTRVLSESFGSLSTRPATVDLELRSSWTPHDASSADIGAHLKAWAQLLCTVAGLPPLPDGVSALPGRRR
ncbi:DUF3000 domain-containing protein [Saxibacter everestensis]|uniref:DUF3000 domain-containing protein n=1 Tax=Saxibacter everestensis TaxID=2909229 RepID=A0ABY8QYB5_9MICO|nr:DUF3000 domain-containing protein [Brevibacteriaceae bacterium ZFBP1038]